MQTEPSSPPRRRRLHPAVDLGAVTVLMALGSLLQPHLRELWHLHKLRSEYEERGKGEVFDCLKDFLAWNAADGRQADAAEALLIYGWPFNDQDNDQTNRFQFSIGTSF